MPLFQNSVVQKYINAQDKNVLEQKWEAYKTHFHNPNIQENIRNAKEEQYQEGFLRDLFVNILGYTLNPETNFNLTTELKNVKDAKKADGGILVNGKVVGVIELKGTNTTDLSKVESQAFGYKNNQKNCTYVITSNFEKLRFYIDNAIEHQAFDLFRLTEKEFKLLYLCLAYENISKGIPKKLKSESLSQEDVITKQLYKDYSLFKRELFNNLTELNPDVEPLLLFKKSQKLLDRFLFLFFAEDRHLLPPNSVRLVLQQWKKLKELDAYTPLFERYKKYFGYLNTGHKGKKYDVYPYNGGLFKPDDILDKISIDDDLLYRHTLKLSEYDFDSEVDVNILGHIFENSLNEIEEIQTQLETDPNAKPKVSKRKKDGVFYTPKYITKYIVENTVGKLCEDQKETLDIVEEDYTLTRQKKTKEKLLKKLKTYRDWLLQLTIVDPACGSGAFLNEALNYLIAEHQYLDELETKLMGGGLVFPNVENSILENNLYGVDINNESVEIAKLSLWLRTAQPNRKLNDLSKNIKCGNSLIDDPEVAGDKAFKWETEFSNVFKEKDKYAYHITTALYDSRTSKRMIEYKVRQKRDGGANPYPNYEKLTAEEEILITEEVLQIVKEDKLQILAYNVCADHIHILLVCEEEEIPKIMQKIKAKTARKVNIHKGVTTPATMEHAPLPSQNSEKEHAPLPSQNSEKEHAPLPSQNSEKEHAPLPSQNSENKHAPLPSHSVPQRGKKQNSLWTQKYGCNPIKDETHLHNTINYIQHNRGKHNLPESQTLNKLIDEMCCTIDEAFTPEYKGGFDVVIGNPPYVSNRNIEPQHKEYFENNYDSSHDQYDLYVLFMELAVEISKSFSSFILPDKFLISKYGEGILKYLSKNVVIRKYWDLTSKKVFTDASVYPIIYVFKKNISKTKHAYTIENFKKVEVEKRLDNSTTIILKLEKAERIDFNVWRPLSTSKNLIDGDLLCVSNSEVNRYNLSFKDGKFSSTNYREKDVLKDKLLLKKICYRIEATLDFIGVLPINTTYCLTVDIKFVELKYILTILNSKLLSFYCRKKYINTSLQGGYIELRVFQIKDLPLLNIDKKSQKPFIEKAEKILFLNKQLHEIKEKFQRSLQREFPEELEKLPKKLQDWHELSFGDFVKELKKKKIKLSLSQQAEWEDYFLEEQQKALDLQAQINTTDAEIDQMVYELYGLTEEEIKIVEES